jgi:hypothetical protein
MRLSGLAIAALLAGCGGKTSDNGGVLPGPSTGGSGGSGAIVGAGGASGSAGPCRQPGTPIDTSALADLKQHILGKWLYCSGPLFFDRPHDGIEFTADYQWYFFFVTVTGEAVRQEGLDGQGKWSFTDTTGMNGPGDFAYQLNFDRAGGGNPIFLKFAEQPPKMRMNWMLGSSDYALISPPPEK